MTEQYTPSGKPQIEATPEAKMIRAAMDALISYRFGAEHKAVYNGLYDATVGMIEAACDRAYGTYNCRVGEDDCDGYLDPLVFHYLLNNCCEADAEGADE